ncbi:hypothetical protein M1D88_13215 [Arthrobacter sp. R1-13]
MNKHAFVERAEFGDDVLFFLAVPASCGKAGNWRGRADSGSIEVDLEELIEDLAEALAETRSGLIFVIDEMQDLDDGLITPC